MLAVQQIKRVKSPSAYKTYLQHCNSFLRYKPFQSREIGHSCHQKPCIMEQKQGEDLFGRVWSTLVASLVGTQRYQGIERRPASKYQSHILRHLQGLQSLISGHLCCLNNLFIYSSLYLPIYTIYKPIKYSLL